MVKSTIATIDRLLESAIEETENEEARFKLRTARQLIDVIEQDNADLSDSLEGAKLDDELREELHKLGYLDSSSG